MYLSNLFLKKIKMKVNFFPKAIKGLTIFQIVILKEKKIFLLFFMIGRNE
jgi:hypothetical protein